SARKYKPDRSASAKLVPSAEMPKPENIGRIVTGPKSENRSIRKSRSIGCRSTERASLCQIRHCERSEAIQLREASWIASSHALLAMTTRGRIAKLPVHLCSLQLHRFAATTGAGLVRIVEDELRLHLVGLVVHLGAEQKQHGLGIDQDLDALVFDHLVGGTD